MLRPLLFIIYYLKLIDEGLINRILKFADDTKLVGVVTNGHNVEKMMADLCTLRLIERMVDAI